MKKLLTVFAFACLLATLPAKAIGVGGGDDGDGGGEQHVCQVFTWASAPVAINGTAHWAAGVPGRSTVNNFQYSNYEAYYHESASTCAQLLYAKNFTNWDPGAGALIFPYGGNASFAAVFDNNWLGSTGFVLGAGTGGGQCTPETCYIGF